MLTEKKNISTALKKEKMDLVRKEKEEIEIWERQWKKSVECRV